MMPPVPSTVPPPASSVSPPASTLHPPARTLHRDPSTLRLPPSAFSRLSPSEGWLTLGLLLALVWSNLHTVESAGWGERIELAPRVALGGILVGLLAAKSRIRTIWGFPLTLLIGLELVLLAHAATAPGGSWAAQLGWLSESLLRWLRIAAAQGATHDPVVFALSVSLIAYVIGLCSSWLVFRLQNGWWPLVVNAGIGVVHLSYATVESIPPYLVSLFIGILMVASLELHLRRGTWRAIGLPVHGASAAWTLLSAATVGGLALLLSTQLPAGEVNADLASRYQEATEPWRDFQRGIDQLVGGSKGSARPGSGLAFSNSLAPRGDFDLRPDPVLKVASPVRRYWRTTTYDLYDGHSIKSTVTADRRYDATQPLAFDPDGERGRVQVEVQVTILAAGAGALFAPDAPRTFSLPATTDERDTRWDLAGLRPANVIQRGQSYTAVSSISVADPRQLSEAPPIYPDWLDRYRELPIELPPRVGELANRLTQDARTPYDRASAIQEYFRALTYSTHVEVPPDDRDWVDFLLFDSRTGYCDYFATAMTVMLRTQNIPARVASGFATGSYDEQEQAFVVRESDAHSWPEAYFPGYGWIAFEPSAIRPTPERALQTRQDSTASATGGAQGPLDDLGEEFPPGLGGRGAPPPEPLHPTPVALALGGLASAVLIVGLVLGLAARAWERRLAHEPPTRRRYGHFGRALRWGKWPVRDAETPFELARRFGASFPPLARPAQVLARHYVETTYGGRRGGESNAVVEQAWRAIRLPLLKAMLRRRLAPHRADRPRHTRDLRPGP